MMPARGPMHIIRARSTAGDRQEGDWEPGGASAWVLGALNPPPADPPARAGAGSGALAAMPAICKRRPPTRRVWPLGDQTVDLIALPRASRDGRGRGGGGLGRARGLAVASHGAHGGPPNGVPARSRSLGKTKFAKARTKTMWHSQFTAQRHISKQKHPGPTASLQISPPSSWSLARGRGWTPLQTAANTWKTKRRYPACSREPAATEWTRARGRSLS